MIRYAQHGDVHVAYEVRGQRAGAPRDLLLVSDGFIPFDAMDELPALGRILRRFTTFGRLILFDRRGIGLSDPFPPGAPPSLDDWVEDAVAVLDAVGSTNAAVIGSVETATIAMLLAATHPDRVDGLVLLNVAARAVHADDYPHGHPLELVESLIEYTTSVDTADATGDPVELVAPSAAGDPVFRRWWERTGRAGASPSVARAFLRLAVLADLRAVLPAIHCPVLVVRREDDPLVTSGMARYVADHVRRGSYVEVPGADNLWFAGPADAVVDEIERFLTGELQRVDVDRALATIMFTDIVGSTELLNELGDERWRVTLDAHDDLVRRQLARFGGQEVKATGDGFLVTFTGPARAIHCAEAIRTGAAQLGLELRIGLHVGEIDLRGKDIGGANVHVAARVAAIADPGDILVTGAVQQVLAGHRLGLEPHGARLLRGFPDPWPLYRRTSR
ncbi:MAG: adenylate/guanylate cyclase domain-containing protein [Actinobacteria bacterium]|nr:adenylate/guanylate cyclase domain-containing protein [Actinomycetota bacterium]